MENSKTAENLDTVHTHTHTHTHNTFTKKELLDSLEREREYNLEDKKIDIRTHRTYMF